MIERVQVESQSSERSYVVTFVAEAAVACTCPDFHYRAGHNGAFSCKHMRSAQAVTPLTLTRAETIRFRSFLAQGV